VVILKMRMRGSCEVRAVEGWKKFKVRDVCELGRGRVISGQEIERNPGVFPVYSSQSSNNGEMGAINTFDFDGEYVTWTTDGAYAGTVFYRSGQFNCTNVCGTLRAKDPQVCMPFLAYKLSTLAKDYVSYVGNPKLMNGVMAGIEFSIPTSKPEQTKIAEVLSTVDRAIEQTEALIAKQQRIKTGLMQDLLTRGIDEHGNLRSEQTHQFKDSPLGRIPEVWEVVQLGNVSEISSGVTLGKIHSGPNTIELPYLRVANVQDGYLDLTEIKVIRVPKSNVEKYQLKAGDVLMNEGGDFDKLGRGTVWNNEIPHCLHQNHIFKVRPKEGKLSSDYLAAVSASPYGKTFFVIASKQSTNLASINSTQLKLFPVPLPLYDEQLRIDMLIKQNAAAHYDTIRQRRKFQSLKKALMQDLLTGKIRVTPLLDKEEAVAG